MLEICFSDSVKGSLTLAQNCDRMIGGATAVFTGSRGLFARLAKRKALKALQKRKQELQKRAIPLSGSREDVVSIPLCLSEDDILSPIIPGDCPRKSFLHSLFTFARFANHRGAEEADPEALFSTFWEQCIADLERLKACSGKVRIWLDTTPDAQCGLRFLANLLQDSAAEIHIVELPERVPQEDGSVVFYRSWGEVEPELFGSFLDCERALAKEEVQELSRQWEAQKAENTPLRVYENGTVRGVPESYYDQRIMREFPDGAARVAVIIGNVLGRQNVPTGDAFIAKRIQHFIRFGELTVTEPGADGFYSTVVAAK